MKRFVWMVLVAALTGCGASRGGGLSNVSYGELLAVLAASQSIGRPVAPVPASVLCLPMNDGVVHCSSFP